jgi:hypothetical protein
VNLVRLNGCGTSGGISLRGLTDEEVVMFELTVLSYDVGRVGLFCVATRPSGF